MELTQYSDYATGWTIGVHFPAGAMMGLFLFTTASKTALGPKTPIQRVPRALTPAVKRHGCEANHSPPSRADIKNAWSYIYTPPIRLQGVVLN